MITDSQTNFLYLADTLPKKYSDFYKRFEKVLIDCNIKFALLPKTKDVWTVDYMPIQIDQNRFVQFVYNPDYLQSKTQPKTISNIDNICKAIGIVPKISNLLVDGGNVIRSDNSVIMCDKVFKENATINEKVLIQQLKETFEIDKLFFVPWDKTDFTGHADGMVRFVNNDTVLINDYSNLKEDPEFAKSFRTAINKTGLNWIEIPYNPYENKTSLSAEGIYMNYLQMKQTIIVPTFKQKEDDIAITIFEQVFKGQKVVTVDSNEIAKKGGILNCISWNIIK